MQYYLLLATAFMVIGLLLPSSHIVPPKDLRWAVSGVWVIAIVFNVLAVRVFYVTRPRF
jgi:hypothetical protein